MRVYRFISKNKYDVPESEALEYAYTHLTGEEKHCIGAMLEQGVFTIEDFVEDYFVMNWVLIDTNKPYLRRGQRWRNPLELEVNT